MEFCSLVYCAGDNRLKDATNLIAEGVDVNEIYPSTDFFTALFAACCRRNINMVRLLVEHGADVEITDRCGETCLTHAIHCIGVVRYLLSTGVRVNRRKVFGRTTLHDYHYNPKLLFNKGVIMRNNENGESPIVSMASCANRQVVQYLGKYIKSDYRPKFARHSNQAGDDCSSGVGVMEMVDAYKLLGASFSDGKQMNTIQAWSEALSLGDKADFQPKRALNRTPSCTFCTQVNAEEAAVCTETSESSSVWASVSVVAREIVTGMELLQRAISRDEPTWMSEFLPSFHCTTCQDGRCVHSLEQVRKVRRCCVFDKAYLEKWQHLRTELQSLYERKEVFQPRSRKTVILEQTYSLLCNQAVRIKREISHVNRQDNMSVNRSSTFRKIRINGVIIKPISMTDAVLGIEPTCFVQTGYAQNNVDPCSYHLQRQWLIAGYAHPRTDYRCSFNVCTTCGQMVIQFGQVEPFQSPGVTLSMLNNSTHLVCKRCTLYFRAIGNQVCGDWKESETNGGYHNNFNSKPQLRTAVVGSLNETVNKKAAAVKVCPHCCLVSEQHPLLQRLWQCNEEAIGDVREFSTKEGLKECKSNLSALRLQKFLINLRFNFQTHPLKIIQLVTERTTTADITASTKAWRYVFQYLKVFYQLDFHTAKFIYHRFKKFVSRALAEKNMGSIDPSMVVDFLELAVDCIERIVEKTFYRRDEKGNISGIDYSYWSLLLSSLWVTSLVLSYYLPEVPFRKSSLRGRYLIDLVAKEYCQDRNGEDMSSPHFFEKLSKTATATASKSETSLKQGSLSPALIRRFIGQVYRLVCLDQRSYVKQSLIHRACTYVEKSLTVKLFLRLGADPNRVNSDGETVVEYILRYLGKEKQKAHCFLAALIEAGVHLDAGSNRYRSESVTKTLHYFLQEYNICSVDKGKLVCLTAAAMQRNGLTSRNLEVRAQLPRNLLTFLDLH